MFAKKDFSGFLTKKEGSTVFFDVDGSVGHQGTPRTFYIYGDYTVRVQGIDYEINTTLETAEYVQIPDITRTNAIVYNPDGDLEVMAIPPDMKTLLQDNAITAFVYWNADTSSLVYFGDERHGVVMDWETHKYEHLYERTRYKSGLGITVSSIDGTGDDEADAQLGVDDGAITDEDVEHTITGGSPQVLTAPAEIPIIYRYGATSWRIKKADAYPLIYSDGVIFTGANGRAAYNQNVAGSWQLTEVGNLDFVLTHIFATNDPLHPIVGICGQGNYATLSAAREGANTEINSLVLNGIPFEEFKFIGTVIFQTAAEYDNTPAARTRTTEDGLDYVDWRITDFNPGGLVGPAGPAGTTDHALLTNLDYASAGHTGFEPAQTKGNLTATSPITLSAAREVIGGAAVISLDAAFQPRERLTAARTYYVRTDGNDSNTGLVDSADGAFLTPQAAVNAYQRLDCNGYDVTIQVRDGTYTSGFTITGRIGAGRLFITGNVANPANVFLDLTSKNGINASGHPAVSGIYVSGFRIKTTTGGGCIKASNGSTIYYSAIVFDTCAGSHVESTAFATVYVNGNYTITGSAAIAHWLVQTFGLLGNAAGSVTITLSGTPAFSWSFLLMIGQSIAVVTNQITFSGSGTGKRYEIVHNALANTYSSASTYLPGNVAGTVATGGQYL